MAAPFRPDRVTAYRFAPGRRPAQGGHGWFAWLGAAALVLGLIVVLPGRGWFGGEKPKVEPPKEGVKADVPDGKAADVVFVLDATGSMDAHIKNLRDSMGKLAQHLELAKVDARFAVAIYRDRVDDVGNKPEDPFILKIGDGVFTKHIAALSKMLEEIKADGGGDFPESSFDGLDFASKLPFRKEARKILILVTDAPPRVPDKEIKDEAQLAKNLQERGIDQLHVFHDLEPERYKKLQGLLGKAGGRAINLFPSNVEAMQAALVDIGKDISGGGGPEPVAKVGSGKVDVVLVLDTTGSMDLPGIRDNIGRLFRKFEDKRIDFRIGLVTFKDRFEAGEEHQSHMIGGEEFTRSSSALNKVLAGLTSGGGGDLPESGFDALLFASRRTTFRPDAQRVLFLITDAPAKSPDKEMKDERETANALKKNAVHQLHMIVSEDPKLYQEMQRLLGPDVGISRKISDGHGPNLDAIGDAILARLGPVDPPPVVVAKGSGQVDVVFVVDTTGSMGPDIATLRDGIKRFDKVFKDAKVDARFGLVTFKDRVEDPVDTRDPKSVLIDGKELSPDGDGLSRELGKLVADGGGDEPESGLDALDFASKRTFRPGARKVLILVTDGSPRVPDKEMKDEDQVAGLFKKRGIDQFHIVARGALDRYARLVTLNGKGKVVNLGRGDDFAGGLEDIAREASIGLKAGLAKTTNKVDIIIVLDATGSMEAQITGVRENVKKLLTNLEGKKLDVRIGVTVFRDAVDTVGTVPEDPFSLKFDGEEFTKAAEKLEKELATVVAKDGGDIPESGFDALEFSSRRPFRADAARVLIVVTDAPPRAPDKKMRDERDTSDALRAKGIHQLHLITSENPKLYEEVQRGLERGGRSAGLKFSLTEGKTFGQMFDAISDGIVARLDASGPGEIFTGGPRKVDVLFVVDTTGSMGGDLTAFKDSLPTFLKVMKDNKIDFQAGIVEFKDRIEDPPETREHKLHMIGDKAFTNDGEALMRVAGNLRADGGGDLAESGLDALEFASKQKFRVGARRVLVLVTDAPPRIPDKDMKDEEQVAKLFRERRIDQFHMIARGGVEKYENLVKLQGRGKVIHLDRGGAFPAGMEIIGKEATTGLISSGSGKVDIMFLLDTTGSMDAHLKNVRDHVPKFAQVLKEGKTDFRIGVVTYTDRVDDPPPNNEHKSLKFAGDSEFTTDADEVSREVGKLMAFGGGDAPESGLDAIEFASRRAFRPDARKVFILVTDEGPRVPDKEMKDEDQVGRLLKERGIDSLHLMVGSNSERYVKLSRMLADEGKILDLAKLGAGDDFRRSFEDLARASISGDPTDRGSGVGGTKVDLVFVIDTTGSMGDFAGNTIAPAERIFSKLVKEGRLDVRMALVEYKDRHMGDGNTPFDQRVVQLEGREFTTNFEDFRKGVGTLKADGGGDGLESSLDALAFAAKRDFRFDALKVVLLITDEGPKIPDKDMRDETDVLRIFKEKGIHQLHLISGANAERYLTLQRTMGRGGKVAGKQANIGDRGNETFNKVLDEMVAHIMDGVRTEGHFKLTERPLAPLRLEKTEKGQPMVDVVFVLDVTASMGPEINWVKDGAPKILKKLRELEFDARFGLTFFRDRVDKDGNVPEDPQALLFGGDEFTRDMEEFKKQVATLKALGGGDAPESSLDGMEFASRRAFRKGAYKVLILVTDAPPRVPDKDMKDEFQLGELLRERGIHQLHLLLKTEPHPYTVLQRFLTGDGSPAGMLHDLTTIGNGERSLDRLMDALSRSMAGETRRALDRMAKGGPK